MEGLLPAGTSGSFFVRSAWMRWQRSPTYDVLMRLPVLSWALLVSTASAIGFLKYLHKASALPIPIFAISVAMRLSTIIFLIVVAVSVIARTRPAAKARGVEPRLCALVGTFLIYSVCLFQRRELSSASEIASTLLILTGSAAAAFAVSQLGRSFSIMPEARKLVTGGAYRFVRHPIYLAEELATIGLVMQFLSKWTALILVAQIAFQLRRMRNEELVLAKSFPEYSDYSERTARLIPWIY